MAVLVIRVPRLTDDLIKDEQEGFRSDFHPKADK